MLRKILRLFPDNVLKYISRTPFTHYVPFITLTYGCNFSCRHCFIRGLEKEFPVQMSIENFNKLIRWIKKQRIYKIQLWGGEPTTHPQFCEILDICKREGLRVWLYTNNFFNDSIMEKLSNNDYTKRVIIDYFPPLDNNPNYKQYLKNLDNLYKKRIKFFFFCRLPFPEDSYNDLIEKLKKYRTFAEGRFLMPGFSGPEISIEELKAYSRSVLKFLKLIDEEGLSFEIRDSIPRCIFSDDEWEYLKKYHKGRMRCYPGAYNPYDKVRMGYACSLTINPDLSIFPCIGVFFKGPNILSFKNIKEVDDFLKKTFWEKWRWSIPLMKECESCKYFINKECQGGCLNHKYHKQYKNRIIDINRE